MKFFYILLLMVFTQLTFAQKTFLFPKVKAQGNSVEQLTPIGWTILQKATGDLNNDGSDDMAIVFESYEVTEEIRTYGDNNSAIIKETQKPRILSIFFKDATSGIYRLSVQNNDFILRASEGGKIREPLNPISIKDQQLYLRFKGGAEWRWEMGYTFKYEKKDWFLTSAISLYFNQNTGDMTERVYDFKTRELFTTVGNLHRRAISNRTVSEVLYFSQLRTFKTFKKPWAWEIMPDVYL